ncbi:MAG: ABC transporter ATP-binding protein [Oscillospiraceae bacterium]|nr:ABC transporter ATP-binding protein [Oscillospiraceae bacterium]
MKLLWKYFDGYKKELVLGPLCKLAEAVLELFIPLLMAQIVDVGIPAGDGGYVLKMGGFMLLFGAVGLCCALVCQYYAALAGHGFGQGLRNGLFKKIMTFSGAETEAFGADSLITRLTGDVTQLQNGVNMFIRLAVRAPFLTVGSLIMAFVISPPVGCLFLAALLVIALILFFIMRRSVPHYLELQKRQDVLTRLTGENLEGARVIRAFCRQQEQAEAFDEAGGAAADTAVRIGRLAGLLNPLTYAVANLAIIGIVWMGAGYADSGVLENGQIIALVSYMTQTLLVLIVFANLVTLFTKAFASAKRIVQVLETEPAVREGTGGENGEKDAARLRFEKVDFSYPGGGGAALRDISFAAAPGQTIGVIGGTGAGKSTLGRLICRFYDVTAGRVLVDGTDVRAMPLEALRGKIGYVPQGASLFRASVRENIRFGKDDATEEEIWAALRTAQAAEIVEKWEDGLDTQVAEGGKNLSGGQRQRFTIARALVRKPALLILDDAASALDYATDAALRRALRSDLAGTTVLMISQRAATIKNADLILVLDDGELAAAGTHEELLQASPLYREICVSQKLVEEEGAL